MRREAIAVATAVALSTVLLSACDKPRAPETGTTGAGSSTPPPSPASPATTSPQSSAPAAPSASEKETHPPIQGQVDPKSPPQQKDFQTK